MADTSVAGVRRANTGEMVGSLATFNINVGLNSPHIEDSSGTVPSANITVAEPSSKTIHSATDTRATLVNGAGETLFSGTLLRAVTSDTSDVATLSLDGIASRLNQEVNLAPVLPAGAATLRYFALNAYMQCGIFPFEHGSMLFQAANHWRAQAYVRGASLPLLEDASASTNTSTTIRKWAAVAGNTVYNVFRTGDILRMGALFVPNASGTVPQASLTFGRNEGTFTDEGGGTAIVVGTLRIISDFTAGTVTVREEAGATNYDIASQAIPAGTTHTRVEVRLTRTNSTTITYRVRFLWYNSSTLATSYADVSATSTRNVIRERFAVTAAECAQTGTDFAKCYGVYLTSGGSDLPTTDVFWQYNSYQTDNLTVPSGALVTIPGMSGNAWQTLNDLCSLYNMTFDASTLRIHNNASTAVKFQPGVSVPAGTSVTSEAREKAETVEVVNYDYAVAYKSSVKEMWRADGTYTLEKGEVQEHVIQTEQHFTSVAPIRIITALTAVGLAGTEAGKGNPYTTGGVQYSYVSIFSNDNIGLAASTWQDNGGAVTVSLGKQPGEIVLRLQAPTVDIGAPYSISLVGQMPGVFIFGSGIRANKKTITAYTGAGPVPRKVGTTYDNPNVCAPWLAWNTAANLGQKYGTTSTTINGSLEGLEAADAVMPRQYRLRKGGAIYALTSGTFTQHRYSAQDSPRLVTCKDVNDEYTGLTCAQHNDLHAGKSVKQVNMFPLNQYID